MLQAGEQELQHKVSVGVGSCRVQQVTVYNDRAEVTRLVSLPDLPAGM